MSASSLSASPAELLDAARTASHLTDSETAGLPLLVAARRQLETEFLGRLPEPLLGANRSEHVDAAAATAAHFKRLLTAPGAAAAHVIDLAALRLGRAVPGDSSASQLARVLDRGFWLKHYSKLARQRDEFSYIKSGLVSSRSEQYVSDSTLARHTSALAAQQAWLESSVLIDAHAAAGGKLKHIKLVAAVKRAEARDAGLWAFLTGIEQLSIDGKLECALVTLTAPSHFHANPGTGGGRFDGVSTPLDSHKYIAQCWNALQRDLDNAGYAVSGIRATEPQGDGTCHWHVWLHYAPAALQLILSRLAHYFPGDLSRRVEPLVVRTVEPDFAGVKVNKKTGARFSERFAVLRAADLVARSKKPAAQVDFSVINRSYASGATYMAKYTVKSFDKSENSRRVHAWRWTWGVRGFQVFGIRNCRGLWNELYRADERPADPRAAALWRAVHSSPGKHSREVVNPLTGARETQEYEGGTAAFLRLQGGLAACGRSASLRLRITYIDAQGRYGDVLKRPLGVAIFAGDNELYRAVTREPGRWVLCSEDRVAATVDALSAAAAARSASFPPHYPAAA